MDGWNKIPDELKWMSGSDENKGWEGGGGSRQSATEVTSDSSRERNRS